MRPINKHSQNTIVVKSKYQKVIVNAPEPLASELFILIKEWKVYRVNTTMLNEKHKAPEGTCGGGIERPCKYFLYGPVVYKMFVRNELQEKRVKNKGVFYSCITYPYFVLVF